MVLADIRWSISFKNDLRLGSYKCLLARQLLNLSEILLALLLCEPNDLERVVALDETISVIVNRFARPRQQPGGGVVVTENDVPVGFAALQGDPHCHLIDG